MTSTLKFGVLLGCLLLATAILSQSFRAVQPYWGYLDLIVFAFVIYSGIRSFLNGDPPRPKYNYRKGALIGLGIVAIGSLLGIIMYSIWQYFNAGEAINFSKLMFNFLHLLPGGIVAALLVPLLFLNKTERKSGEEEILDSELK